MVETNIPTRRMDRMKNMIKNLFMMDHGGDKVHLRPDGRPGRQQGIPMPSVKAPLIRGSGVGNDGQLALDVGNPLKIATVPKNALEQRRVSPVINLVIHPLRKQQQTV